MPEINSKKIPVRFVTEWRSDGGLRVYTVEPSGLYVSSRYTYAAAEYFQNMVVLMLSRTGTQPQETMIEMLTDIDWEQTVANGGGVVEFELVKPDSEALEEMRASSQSGEKDFPQKVGEEPEIAEIELKVERRSSSKGPFLVINDFEEADQVLEEIIRRYESQQ